MLNYKTTARRVLDVFAEGIWLATGFFLFLSLTQSVFASPGGSPVNAHFSDLARMLPASSFFPGSSAQQAAGTGKTGTAASPTALETIQAAIDRVHAPNLQLLAETLGLKPAQIGHQAFEDSTIGMETISGLTSRESEVALKWRPSSPTRKTQAVSEPEVPKLYLLSWDGSRWQVSYLTSATDALTLQVLPSTGDTGHLFAVIIFRGVTAAPYPVIFRFRDHHALRIWDGRSDSSQYASYDYGSIQFKKVADATVPYMLLAGRADPGLLIFPASEEEGDRGFQAVTVYAWRNGGYVPIRTEYTHNRDYTIYRFIAALHLHDFKEAYSLIDPAKFLKTKKPSLKLFRKRIQNVWPEFTDDRIFEVPEEPVNGSGSHAFILRLGHGKLNVYSPSFTSGPAYRLVGLTRTESKE